jgi:ribosomal protein L7Ae-like RNA K-turn-binding protein
LTFSESEDTELLAVAQRTGALAIYSRNRADESYGFQLGFEIRGLQSKLDLSDAVSFVPPNNNYLAAVLDLLYQPRERHAVAQGANEVLKAVRIGCTTQVLLVDRIDTIRALSLQLLSPLYGFGAVLDLLHQLGERHSIAQSAHEVLKAIRIGRTTQVLLVDGIDPTCQLAVIRQR